MTFMPVSADTRAAPIDAAPARSPAFDLLRLAAGFGVVLIHAAAPLLTRYEEHGAGAWWIGNLYDAAARWCVPVFVMLSGALVLGRNESLGRFWSKRGRKVLVPFVAWSLVYAWWSGLRRGDEPDWLRFLREPAYYHLWFFYMILGLYLVTPVLDAALRAASGRVVVYALGIWFLWASVAPMLEAQLGVDSRLAPSRDNSSLQFAGYFVLGSLLQRLPPPRRERLWAAAALLVGFGATALGTYHATIVMGGGRFDGRYYEFYSANVMLMALAVFIFGRRLSPKTRLWQSTALRRALAGVAKAVLGVYLVHALVLDLVSAGRLGFEIDRTSFHPAVGVPLLATLVFVLSLAVVLVLRRVPLLRELVP